jgi:hypothetical protein
MELHRRAANDLPPIPNRAVIGESHLAQAKKGKESSQQHRNEKEVVMLRGAMEVAEEEVNITEG